MTAEQPQAEPPALPAPDPAPARPRGRSLALFAALLVALNVLLLVTLGFIARDREMGADQSRQALMLQIAGLRERVGKLEAVSNQATGADTALQDRIGALETRLAALPKDVPAAPTGDQPAALGDLTKRLAALEARPALEQRVAALETARLAAAAETSGRIDALEKDVRETVKPALAGLAQAAPQQASKADLQAVLGRLTALEAGEDKRLVKTAASALAVSVLAEAVRTGMPYEDELSAVRRLAPAPLQSSPALETLSRQAATGVPTQEALISAFPAAARAAREAETMRDTGMMGAIRRTLGDLVSFRMPGASTESALDAMTKALRRDDLTQALTAAQVLEPKARAALEPWLARARLRQSGLSAVMTLRTAAIRDLAATATQ